MTQGPLKSIAMQIAFDEGDGEGIVFFGNYFRLAHRALEQFLPQLGISWQEWFNHPEMGVPLRHVEADYLGPIRPGETIQIAVRVAELGESSVKFAYEFLSPSGAVTSRLITLHVFADRKTFKKTPIPMSIRQRLEVAR